MDPSAFQPPTGDVTQTLAWVVAGLVVAVLGLAAYVVRQDKRHREERAEDARKRGAMWDKFADFGQACAVTEARTLDLLGALASDLRERSR